MPDDPDDRTRIERVDPLLGSILDRRFRIEDRLAAGGFGAIYRATHVESGRAVALKVLRASFASDPGVIARFRREGAALIALRSPHTIAAYELGEASDGTLYIVMELLRGESLFERFRSRGRFEWKRMVAIARAICTSLEEAHGRGIVHRDLKPTNIHLERVGADEDFVKVLDFGIAKILRDSDFDSSDLTDAGQMIGTLDYMSPEQMVGGVCTGQTDIYTLGIVTYEMIAGRRPFAPASTAPAALAAMLKTTPKPLAQCVPVPAAVERVVMRCLEREAHRRYADVRELGAALDALLAGHADEDELTRTVAMGAPLGAGALEFDGSTMVDAPTEGTEATVVRPPLDVPPWPSGGEPVSRESAELTLFRPRPAPAGASGAPPPLPAMLVAAPPPPLPPRAIATPPPLGPFGAPPSSGGPPSTAPSGAPFSPVAPPPHPGALAGPFAATPVPPAAYPPATPASPGTHGLDPAEAAARAIAMRRFVWIAVLALGALLGVIAASGL